PARMTWRVPVVRRRARTSSTPQQEKFTLGTGCTSGPSVSLSSGRVWPRPLGYCSVAITGRPRRRAVVARILMLRITSSRWSASMAGKSRAWTSTITRVVPSRGRVMECVPDMRGLFGERSEAAVEAAILHGLGHVLHVYPLTSLEVRDSASDLEDAVVAAGGEAQAVHRLLEEPGSLRGRCTKAPHLAPAHAGVHPCPGAGEALALTLAGSPYPSPGRPPGRAPPRRA